MDNIKVQANGEGKADLIQTFSLAQWQQMVIQKSQDIERKNRDWKKEDAERVKNRATEMDRKNAELLISQNGFTAAGGDLKALETPPIQ